MKRLYAALLIGAQLALSACSGSGTDATVSAMLTSAPCPAADNPDPLAGIEGWAPGAGQASKMADSSTQNVGGMGAAMGGEAPPTATPSPSATGDCKSFTPWMNDKFTRLAALRKQLPTTTFDVAAAAATFTSPDAAFAFVRDHIRTEAYAGAMRGARGTLMGKAGSPADKAQLLHDLLAAQHVTSRYVHTTLTPADAAKLAAAAVAAPTIARTIGLPIAKDALSAGIGVASSQAATARTMLASKGLQLGSGDPIPALAANLGDHWWLQAQIDGAWVDLDPSATDAKRGTHAGGAPAGDPVEALPDAIQQRIAVRIVAQTESDASTTIAQAESTTADAVEAPIIVAMNGDAGSDADAIRAQTSFVPSVTIGSTGGNGDAYAPDTNGSRMLALYLEVETDAPGAKPVVHRHTIVDRRGSDGKTFDPAWTPVATAFALTFAYGGLESTGNGDANYDAGVNTDALLRGALAADYAALHPGDPSFPNEAYSPYPYEAHRFFQYDQSIRLALQQQNPALSWTYARPMVAFLRHAYSQRKDGLHYIQLFDIVDNSLVATAAGKVAATENVERGLMDTSVEGTLLTGPGTHLDTSSVFAAAKNAGVATVVLPQGDGTTRLAPASPVTIDGATAYGWLEIDPASGNAVGRMSSGAGQAATEQAILEKYVGKYSDIKGLARCLNCYFSAGAGEMAGDAGAHMKFSACVVDAICQYFVDKTFDWIGEYGFETGDTISSLITGPYADLFGEIVKGGPTGAVCGGLGSPTNPYSRQIIG